LKVSTLYIATGSRFSAIAAAAVDDDDDDDDNDDNDDDDRGGGGDKNNINYIACDHNRNQIHNYKYNYSNFALFNVVCSWSDNFLYRIFSPNSPRCRNIFLN